ncbi:PadR family transcriptional regulator [Thermoleophilia bacterium SCSIO 60948]|nr:PadR family transcriptional regulator [Thermoleophilia bacterium SCSIO 60948]
MPSKGQKQEAETLAEAARTSRERAAKPAAEEKGAGKRARSSDVFGSEMRRRDILPLLVLHLCAKEPTFGNRMIAEIERITDGVLNVNPNTIYPLLRSLEERGLIKGEWEHPDRRSRRFYAATDAGRAELQELVETVRPFLDALAQSVRRIREEALGGTSKRLSSASKPR